MRHVASLYLARRHLPVQAGRLRLTVGIERAGGDAANQSSYHTHSPIYEWT